MNCPTCREPGEVVSGRFDGYIEGYRVAIVECGRCGLRYADRLDYIHFKDIDPGVHRQVMKERIRFFDACARGVMCPIGKGVVLIGMSEPLRQDGLDLCLDEIAVDFRAEPDPCGRVHHAGGIDRDVRGLPEFRPAR